MVDIAFAELIVLSGQVFTPGSPVNERDLFSGRVRQLSRIIESLSQRGYHAVLFGERGVGKTSLANILVSFLGTTYLTVKINCDSGDTYNGVWKKVFTEIHFNQAKPAIGFTGTAEPRRVPAVDLMPEVVQPDDVRRMLSDLGRQQPILVILDEFDRINDSAVDELIADTIKTLSDSGTNASVLLIGVASSVSDLVSGHASIERALVQIDMPRMSNDEIEAIFNNGLKRLQMTIDPFALTKLVRLSQGLPYIAHLLALHSTRTALYSSALHVEVDHVDAGIDRSLEQWQQSIKTAYYEATKSQQPGNIYREVLLACSLAEVDDMGFFTAGAVRSPLSKILNRQIDIPTFARHLKEFSQAGRGEIITRTGTARKLRYRFVSPLMRSYVIIRGYAEKLIV